MMKKIWHNPYSTFIKVFSLINIILLEVSVGLWVKIGQARLFQWADFTSLYTSFVNMRAEKTWKIFNLDLQTIYQQGFFGGIKLEAGVYPLQYPPVISLIYTPLSFLPYNIAFYIWTALELGLLLWVIYLLEQLFSHWSKNERLVLIITILAFFPLAHTILTGQFSLFLLLCLVQVYLSMKDAKPVNAGIWMAFLLIKPPIVLIPGLLLLSKRVWRGVVSAILTFVALFILSSVLFGFEPWIRYFQLLMNMNVNFGNFPFHPEVEYTLKGLLSRILVNTPTNAITLISNLALILGMVFVLYLWFRGFPPDHPRFKLYFAFTIVLSVFLSLHMYSYDDLILVLPAAVFYDYLRQIRLSRQGYTILIVISPLVFFVGLFTSPDLFGFILPQTAIIMILLGWIMVYIIRDYRVVRKNRITNIAPSSPS
jgi:hypothetical protein